ncbi:helix-turn-helix transcriptional regulator [Cupriavidus taiwanensis]|uniref:Prophage CP4-57 regulatory protein (AlpA) (Modular protein) n=1 Tax=Cupriavidus taiwanensis TaxID=164546 RepID=A0A375J6S0_9BURK|nr:AlpA family phage regulatory protein [Cupriavidus taiwanensis]SPR99316.1 Prophage CP4-57 regulatory protein (AlpA) (modular protein) [Cupriavidus taiwanensis]
MSNTQSPSLRPRKAAEFLGIGVSTLWRWVNTQPGFPKPISLSERTTVFIEGDLAAWRDKQAKAMAASNETQKPRGRSTATSKA